MRTVQFKVHFCGMSDELYAERLRIYKPCHSLIRQYSCGEIAEKASDVSSVSSVVSAEIVEILRRCWYNKKAVLR